MPWNIIVASSEADQLVELQNGAQQIADGISVSAGVLAMHMATSIEDVNRFRLRDGSETELIIITASLPERRSRPDTRNLPGLKFVREVQAGPLPPACILVSEDPEHLHDAQRAVRCELLLVNAGTRYIDDCTRLARKLGVPSADSRSAASPPPINVGVEGLHRSAPAVGSSGAAGGPISPSEDHYALIEVDLPSDARRATFRLRIEDPDDRMVTDSIPLQFSQRGVDELVEESRELSKILSKRNRDPRQFERWEAKYRALGEKIYKLLFTRTFAKFYGVAEQASRCRSESNGGSNVRLRFNLERPVFDGLWEAIYSPEENRFLMLDATISRREKAREDRFSLRKNGGDGVLNILVVRADVDDNSSVKGPDDALWLKYGTHIRLEELPNLHAEVRMLRSLEKSPRRARSALRPAERRKINVCVLAGKKGKRKKPWSLAETVKDELEKDPRRYDVVHFAGHALFPTEGKSKDDRGYLVFSGYPRPEAFPIATVAGWLKDTSVDLIYLSCCHSNAPQAATEFAINNVRMAIGFSWDLDDQKAVDFAKVFYEELLSRQLKVCRAFREARKKLHNDYKAGDPIWASAVLVAQPADWGLVEGILRPPERTPLPTKATRRKLRVSPPMGGHVVAGLPDPT
jgi:hypothetical protein